MGKVDNKLNHLLRMPCIHDKGLLDPGGKLSNGWYYRFINRHQQLVLRKGDPTANVRMDSVNKETMENYFSLLKDTLNSMIY